jgi:four helix bundle protein
LAISCWLLAAGTFGGSRQMRPFRDIRVWQTAHQPVLETYVATRSFPRHELYGLTSQLRRAAASIPTNIVEGSTRSNKVFAHYLNIALGSAAETEYLLLLCKDLGYLETDVHERLNSRSLDVKRMLVSFIKRLEEGTER